MNHAAGRLALGLAGCLALAGLACGEDERTRKTSPEPALELIGEFTEPLHLAGGPVGDGALYVAERAGTVRVVGVEGEVRREPILDLRADVDSEGEGGLFSIAFAPGGGQLFVSYSAPGKLVVERYAWDPVASAPDHRSREELLSIPHPNPVHWGGLLAFGPDGELYLGTGEGGPVYPIRSRAQDPNDLLGKLLRIDTETGDATVVALGLRNPWRYSFDRETGDLWIGDVGDFTEEEVDHLPADQIDGADFGWPAREGTAPTKSDLKPGPKAIEPVLTYSRSGRPDDPRCAITGGFVVRDPQLTSLEGRYLYGDFCDGVIWSVDARAPHLRGTREPTGLTVPKLASFAEDADGRMYAISLDGPVYRLVEGSVAQP